MEACATLDDFSLSSCEGLILYNKIVCSESDFEISTLFFWQNHVLYVGSGVPRNGELTVLSLDQI